MSLETELCKLVDEYINEFIRNITSQFEITDSELKEIWSKTKHKNIVWNNIVGLNNDQNIITQSQTQPQTQSQTQSQTQPQINATEVQSNTEPINIEQIMKANVSELKAICKQYKLTCTGKNKS